MAIPRLVPVFTADVNRLKPELLPFIERAHRYAYGSWSIEQVFEKLNEGDAQAFFVMDDEPIGLVVTTVEVAAERKSIHLQIVVGSRFGDWKHDLINTITRFAKICGCSHITASGRRGWMKKFKELGCREELVNMSIEVK